MVRSVSAQGFREALEACPASPALREQLARFVAFDGPMEQEAVVHEGDLEVSGSFRAPGLCTLIAGNLDVDGVVDLRTNFEEGGLFVVIGNVRCRHFISEYSKCSFIDGDLEAAESIMNGFSDSALSVIGTLRTRLFIGCDIWAEVGAGAEMEYGVGYCLPIGYRNAAAEAIRPRHGEEETAGIVAAAPRSEGYLLRVDQFVDRIRAGQPIFR
jgi:hypothetical protein